MPGMSQLAAVTKDRLVLGAGCQLSVLPVRTGGGIFNSIPEKVWRDCGLSKDVLNPKA